MKKISVSIMAIMMIMMCMAQVPQKMSYQAVIRNSSNELITNKQVGMRISIIQGTPDGNVVYSESQSPLTNSNGLVSIEVGGESGFESIDWTQGPYYVKTETDPSGGTSYTVSATHQLLSVPYALYAGKSGSSNISGHEAAFENWDKNHHDDVTISYPQTITGSKTFTSMIHARGLGLPYTFGPDTAYVGSEGAFIGFGHEGHSEDFIGYKNNRFYFKDSPGGGDTWDPDVIVGGRIGIGVEEPLERLDIDGQVRIRGGNPGEGKVLTSNEAGVGTWEHPSVQPGNTLGEMLYWNGSSWVNVAAGATGQVLTYVNGVPTWLGTGAGTNDVFNPSTGKIWMDRNLGASRAATSSDDEQAYGDLYQWGRAADGHQKRTSGTTSTLSSSDTPGHGNFILAPNSPYDWRSPQNDNLWQGLSGANNPCPSGYRLPTEAEWNAERLSWSTNNAAGAFASPLKLPVAGYRGLSNGSLLNVGSGGNYWSSTVVGTYSRYLFFNSTGAAMYSTYRALGGSVRCFKD